MASMTSLVLLFVAASFSHMTHVSAISQMTNLIWTEKEVSDGVVNIKGIPGDPEVWVPQGVTMYSISYYADDYSRRTSHRVALGFRYADREILFTDRGFKNVYRIVIQVAPSIPYTYWVPLYTVYAGTSTQVNGMAVDWASGSVYWTDALYNWITVANMTAYSVYRHIVTTGLDRPWGIAVYPQKGIMFWSDIGAINKIERSRLDGTERSNFIDRDLDNPLGLTIDYVNDWLYWVDDYRKTIERVDIATGLNRETIRLSDFGILQPKLFGLAIYKNDYIFVSEQKRMSILIFNKTTDTYIKEINAAIFDNTTAIPYDIVMYDQSVQQDINSDCERLQCSDICISDGGQRAHCMCRVGYLLNTTNNRTCYQHTPLTKPMYIYSIGQQLCATPVQISDSSISLSPSFINCFYSMPGHSINSIGFHIYADLLFFSDNEDNLIHRMNVESETSHTVEVISANTGTVHGLAVDWIGDNLYWTLEDRGYIMVSRLDGRFAKVLVRDLVRPKSIVVNPLKGIMYWVSTDSVYVANLDGTNIRLFLQLPGSIFDGTVLDIQRDTLFVVDSSLPGVRSVRQDGTGLTTVLQAINSTLHDVTVYQTYMAWTTGGNSIFFGVVDNTTSSNSLISILRGIAHSNENISHDIITYDEYMQPMLDPNQVDPCDIDNDVIGCKHLCLLVPGGNGQLERRCNCSIGFHLDSDQRSCIADRLYDNFLLLVDPYRKSMYQVSLSAADSDSSPRVVHGIALQTSNEPIRVAYGEVTRYLYWHDDEDVQNSIKLKSLYNMTGENSIAILSNGLDVGEIEAISSLRQLVFTEVTTQRLFLVDPSTEVLQPLTSAQNVLWSALAANHFTGDIYWVEVRNGSMEQVVYTCQVSNCINRQRAVQVLSWNSAAGIVGLTVAMNQNSDLVFWTSSSIYRIVDSSAQNIKTLFSGTDRINITDAVVVDDVVYFTDWNQNCIYKVYGSNVAKPITDPVFSRITDLKAYRSTSYKDPPMPRPPQVVADVNNRVLSHAELGGIIAGGALFLLLLLLLLIICLVLAAQRRRRRAKPTFKTQAHDNPTYMTHREINSIDIGMPVDGGATGVTNYDTKDPVKEKIPIDDGPDFQPMAKGGIPQRPFYVECPGYDEKKFPDGTGYDQKDETPESPIPASPAPLMHPGSGYFGATGATGVSKGKKYTSGAFDTLPEYTEIESTNTHM